MMIGILGGAGRIGQALIQESLGRNHHVTTLIRHKEKLELYKDRITIIQGDATQSKDIATIVSQVDVLIHAVSVPLFHHKPTTLYSETTQAIISARGDTQCKQLIVMSNTGTHHGRKLPWPACVGYEALLGDVADDKEQEELLLTASSLPRTIIKSPLLTNGKKCDYTISHFDTYIPTVLSFISRKTIAGVIIDIAEHNTYAHQKVVPHITKLF